MGVLRLELECCLGVGWRIVSLVVGMSVVMPLVERRGYSCMSECCVLCRLYHPSCSPLVGISRNSRMSRGTLELFCTYLLTV